jgi:AraC-like DNA-binding protein
MALVLSLLRDPVASARLRRAVELHVLSKSFHRIVFVDGWHEAETQAAELAPHVLVLDPFESGQHALSACARFHERFPSVALLPYGSFVGRTQQLLDLAALGVQTVVSRDEDDDPVSFSELLGIVLARNVAGAVLLELGGVVPVPLEPVMRRLLLGAHHRLSPSEVSMLAHRHVNTLREHLRAAGLPPVNKLIVWCRLFHAGNLLADRERSVENVAYTLDFPSPSALRNQLGRYAGMTPQEVRARGGLRAVVARFLERHRAGSWDVGESLLDVHEEDGKESGAGE